MKFKIAMLSMGTGMMLIGCAPFAPPSPMVTFGGPETVKKFHSEAAVAVGTGAALFPDAHTGGQGWLGRYKYGINENLDLGVDAIGVVRNDKCALSLKLASRYWICEKIRLEGGIGVADDSDGKSINGDFAITFGTIKNRVWNYYTSFRFGAAKGYPGDVFSKDSDDEPPADAIFTMLNLGVQAKISKNQRFIYEGGYGYIFPEGQKSGGLIYLSCGLLFEI